MEESNQIGDHHVHFDETVINDELHDNTIIYRMSADGKTLSMQLGFLQIKHRYRIELKIPVCALKMAGIENEANTCFIQEEEKIPNGNCKLLEFVNDKTTGENGKEYYLAKLELFAYKEKLIKEHLRICGKEDSDHKLEITLIARVLGRGKGTPMLRDGVHLLSVEDDDESELSDWQGFSKKDAE